MKPYSQTAFLAAALAGQAAASAARVEAGHIATNFATDIRDAVNAADAAATRGDYQAVAAAEAAVRCAADTALRALRQEAE